MVARNSLWLASISALALGLSACGGGGVASLPPPPAAPPPPPSAAAVSIFTSPTVGEFASVGVSTSGQQPLTKFGALSTAQTEQVHIRYTSGGSYEIQMPGAAWDQLILEKGTMPTDPANANFFQPASAAQNSAYLSTAVAKLLGYQHSELAQWSDGAGRFGAVAFGDATSPAQMPVSGSATYNGIVSGTSDVVTSDPFDGSFNAPVGGTVKLSFDFGKGTLSGAMTLDLQDASGVSQALGTFAFTNTVFSAGNTTYSGKFDTSTAGDNFFLGQFTGPNAQETIGAWAVPFLLSGNAHQAFGAWIAKQ